MLISLCQVLKREAVSWCKILKISLFCVLFVHSWMQGKGKHHHDLDQMWLSLWGIRFFKKVSFKNKLSFHRFYFFYFFNIWSGGWGSMVSIVTMLLTGWSVVRIPVRERDFSIFRNSQTGFGSHPAFYLMGTRVLPWDCSGRHMKLTADILLVLRLECSLTSIPLICLHNEGQWEIYLLL